MRARQSYSLEERARHSGAKYGIHPELTRGTKMAKVDKYITGEFKIKFPKLTEPDNYGGYGLHMVFPQEGEALQEILSLIREVDQTSGEGGSPIEKYQDQIEIKAKSHNPIPCYSSLLDGSKASVKPGDICCASVNIASWDFPKNNTAGVTIWVNSVQKMEDGDVIKRESGTVEDYLKAGKRESGTADKEAASDAGSSIKSSGRPPSDEEDYRKAFGFD